MKPTPGQTYTTAESDTLENISTRAYGDPNLYPKIQNTNNISFTTNPSSVLPVGTTLIIPQDTELENLRLTQLAGALR